MINFKSSTAEQLDQYAKAAAHPAPKADDKKWYEAIGIEVDKDGFNTACTKEEKKAIQEMLKKAKVKVEVVKAAPKKVVKLAAEPVRNRSNTTEKRIRAMTWIPQNGLFDKDPLEAIRLIMVEFDVPKNYAKDWLNKAK